MQKEHEASYVVSVRVSLKDLATIGKFMMDTGFYTPARPSGALAAALRMFADSLRMNNLVQAPGSDEEALIIIGTLRYPLEQLDKQLNAQQRVADRESLREETISMLGASTRSIAELKERILLSPAALASVESFIQEHTPENFTEAEQARLEAERKSNIEMLRKTGSLKEE